MSMVISQGEIWLVEFFPNIGSEIGKKRPAVVVNDNRIGKLPLKTLVPITDWSANYAQYPWMIGVEPEQSNGLTKTSAIDCFQVRNFSENRFHRRLGCIDAALLSQIHQTILKTLNLTYKVC
jgi:mRNA interferase MazF